jgi:hypothetical protein
MVQWYQIPYLPVRFVGVKKDEYINNAFGYPYENGITAKSLKCILEL